MRDGAAAPEALASTSATLVLLPGMDGTTALFRRFVDALPAGVRAVPVVYPPHVALSYDELVELAARAIPDDEPVVLVGESFSGPIATRLAARAPKNVVGLALVASFVRAPVGFEGFWRRVAREELFHVTPPRFVMRLALLGRDAADALVDEARAAVLSVSPRVLSSRVRDVLAVDVRDALAGLAVPVLYLGATRDRLLGTRALDEVRGARDDVEAVLVEGPHLILQRRPLECARILASFADRALRAARGTSVGQDVGQDVA